MGQKKNKVINNRINANPFPTVVWQGWKGAKNTPENNKNKIGKTPKIQTKKSPKRKKPKNKEKNG